MFLMTFLQRGKYIFLIDEHIRCTLHFYGITIQVTFFVVVVVVILIHKIYRDGLISEKFFKYLHV